MVLSPLIDGVQTTLHLLTSPFPPLPSTRYPISHPLFHSLLLPPLLAVLLVAHLLLTRQPRPLRLALLPLLLPALLAPMRIRYDPPYKAWAYAHGLAATYAVFKAVEFAALREPPKKADGSQPGTSWAEAAGLMFAMRGLGWDFGPPKWRSLGPDPARGEFARGVLLDALKHYLAVDAISTLFLSLPRPPFNPLSIPSLPRTLAPLSPLLLALAFALFIQCGITFCYDVLTLLLLLVSPQRFPPRMFRPPLFRDPWSTDSLALFWAKGWHTLIRRSFTFLGSAPSFFLLPYCLPSRHPAKRVLDMLGAFAVSGLFHSFALWPLAHELALRELTGFFLVSGAACLGEVLWTQVAARKVGGWPGRVWMMGVLFVSGVPPLRVLAGHGLFETVYFERRASVCRGLLGRWVGR